MNQGETVEFASKSQEDEHHCLGQQDTWHNEMLTVQGLCMYNGNEEKVMAQWRLTSCAYVEHLSVLIKSKLILSVWPIADAMLGKT